MPCWCAYLVTPAFNTPIVTASISRLSDFLVKRRLSGAHSLFAAVIDVGVVGLMAGIMQTIAWKWLGITTHCGIVTLE